MKALVGSWEPRPTRLLAELASLRSRVSQLEGAVSHLQEENESLRRALAVDLQRDIDLEMVASAEQVEVALTTQG